MKASSQTEDWADTLSIWIHPSGTLARTLGHRDEHNEKGEPPTDPTHQTRRDEDSQRLGQTLLTLLNTELQTNPMQGDAWKGFMLALSFSGDLLTSLTYAITNPLAEDLNYLGLRGVESLYRELSDEDQRIRGGLPVLTMITLLISEGLMATVLDKTLLYYQEEDPHINTDAADLLLSLSLEIHQPDARVRIEICRAIHILSGGETVQIQDLLIGWLQEALLRFPWIWPTIRKAKIIPLLMARAESTCHWLQNTSSILYHGLQAMEILSHLCQDHTYSREVFNIRTHSLLTTTNNARLFQLAPSNGEKHIGSVAQSIQFAILTCVKFMTTPRPDDPTMGP